MKTTKKISEKYLMKFHPKLRHPNHLQNYNSKQIIFIQKRTTIQYKTQRNAICRENRGKGKTKIKTI